MTGFGKDDIDIESIETVFKGYFRIDRYRLRHRTFRGGWTPAFERELFERGHAVVVLPYDPILDRVALTEQFRVGAFAAGFSPWQVEAVAGIIEEGETAEDVARRESVEEAGATVLDLVPICFMLPTAGGSSETMRLYCARVDCSHLGGIHGLEHEHEDIRVFTLGADEAMEWVRDGRITNGSTIVALQWLMLERDNLKRRWGRVET